jgi:hypothetical protein
MRNRRGRPAVNERGGHGSQMRHYSAEKNRHPTPRAAAAAVVCRLVRACCRADAACCCPPASRRTAPSARHRRSDAIASGRREWLPTPDARNRDDRPQEGPRGILRAFRESRAIVRPRSQPELSVVTVSSHGCSLAHSLQAMARNAQRARRFERFENVRLSDRHPLRCPICPSPDTVLTARNGRKTAHRQPVEVVVRPRFCEV